MPGYFALQVNNSVCVWKPERMTEWVVRMHIMALCKGHGCGKKRWNNTIFYSSSKWSEYVESDLCFILSLVVYLHSSKGFQQHFNKY